MTTATETAKPRAIRLGADRSELIPQVCKATPKAVAVANEAALAAIEEQEAALVALSAAIEAAKQAPQIDRERDKAALAAGEEMPERTEPQRRAELTEANRRAQAVEGVAKQRMRELSGAIAEAWPEWVEAQRETVAASKAELDDQIDALRATFRAHQVEAELLGGLVGFAGRGNFTGFGRPHADRAEARAVAKAEAAERSHFSLRPHGNVPRELPALFAALKLFAEEES